MMPRPPAPAEHPCDATAVAEAFGGIDDVGEIRYRPGERGLRELRVFGRYALVAVIAGGGDYEDATGRRSRVRRGDWIWVFPDLPQRYGPGPDDGWSELYLVLRGGLPAAWERLGILRRDQPIWHAGPPRGWLRDLRSVTECPRPILTPPDRQTASRDLRELGRLQILMGRIRPAAAVQTPPAPPAARDWAATACRHLRDLRDARAAAAAMHLSYARFRQRFSSAVRMPPGRYLAALQMEDACRLLADPALTLAEIAERTGFADRFHFSRRFKQRVGQTPAAYRRSLP